MSTPTADTLAAHFIYKVCPETGLYIQQYEGSCLSGHAWEPTLPEGWEVYDEDQDKPHEHLKWHEWVYTRRVGPARKVWALGATKAGVTFTPATEAA
jgi:hypothetical protein